jgi:hypothetical protein
MNGTTTGGEVLVRGEAFRIVKNRDVFAKPTWMCSRRARKPLP